MRSEAAAAREKAKEAPIRANVCAAVCELDAVDLLDHDNDNDDDELAAHHHDGHHHHQLDGCETLHDCESDKARID